MRKRLFSIALITYSFIIYAKNSPPTSSFPPKLIVQIVIDQLRGDLLAQSRSQFSSDGFNYLFNHGINYQNAHHPQALTVTCVGHANIATGSIPALHGIIANDWYDPLSKKIIYCTEDPASPLLPNLRSKGNHSAMGQSPHNIVASTFSDELILAELGHAFAVSLKDRAAITLAGHAGKAFWFDKEHGGFITSQYYYRHYPKWVDDWNQSYQPKNKSWELMSPLNTYRYAKAIPIQRNFPGFDNGFPHQLGEPNSSTYYKYLAMTPFADELTADFAIDLLSSEHLGKRQNKTDYLAISFSAVDVIGHQFSPNSLESEDNLRRLDRTIAKLLKAINTRVGLNNTLIVITADHGMTDSPSWLTEHHLQPAPGLNISHLQQTINKHLQRLFNLPPETVEFIKPPYIYLNHHLISDKKLSINQVSNGLIEALRGEPGLFSIYPLPIQKSDQQWLSQKVAKMDFPGRSGDLYIVPKPYQDIVDTPEIAITHGSPWNYDSYVPLLFVNPRFKPSRIARRVYTTDIAPTLTELLLIKPPSASVGTPLYEALDSMNNIFLP